MPETLTVHALPATPLGGDPGVCARCALCAPSCCVTSLRDIPCCFALNDDERAAITAHAGSSAGMVQEPNTPAFIEAMQAMFPGERRRVGACFPPSAVHWRLDVDARGACRFLGDQGCALPREVRPIYCRIFPFWIRRGAIWHFAMSSCQAQREARNPAGLMQTFNTTPAEVEALYQRIRHGWGLNG